MTTTARKAFVYALTGFNTFVATYAWSWLAALVAIVIGTLLIWVTPNSPGGK